uniref:G-protein coupled receptors family 1 profile domain-containing protein n=1 Tax=Neogobius melanostomus TaxID=47308 RepID=A0A8C6SWY8_9GOBI
MDLISDNFTNISTSGHPPPSFSMGFGAVAPAVVMSLCFLVGFPGNLAVIILKPNWQKMSRLSQSLMMNLALSDLLCLGTLPLWIYDVLFSWTLGTVTCKIVGFVSHCSVQSSVLTVTALSVQRYMQITHQQRCLQLLVLLWLISMILSIPALVIRKIVKHDQQTMCSPSYSSSVQQVAVLFTESLLGFSSFLITASTYICLNRKLNRAVFFNSSWTSKLVSGIIVTFFVLWMPYFMFDLVIAVAIVQKVPGVLPFFETGYNVFASVTFINSCLNPLLYAFAFRMCGKSKDKTSENNATA